jgi:RNA polymerase sigma factor (sigma-70 family)
VNPFLNAWLTALGDQGLAALRAGLYRKHRSEDAVDDAISEAFVRVARINPETVKNPQRYLMAVAQRVQSQRSRPLSDHQLDLLQSRDPLPGESLLLDDEIRALTRSLKHLPSDQLKLLNLVVVQGLSLREAAKILKYAPSTARSLLHQSLSQLRGLLRD